MGFKKPVRLIRSVNERPRSDKAECSDSSEDGEKIPSDESNNSRKDFQMEEPLRPEKDLASVGSVSFDSDSDDWGDVEESPVKQAFGSHVEAKTRFSLSRCLFNHAKQSKG